MEHAYTRARDCASRWETPPALPGAVGLWRFYYVRGEFQTARELGEQLLTLAQRQHDPALLLWPTRPWEIPCSLGEFVPARAHLEQGMALYDPQQHRSLALLYGQDPGVVCLAYAALILWLLGYPDQALQRSQEALTLAQELSHPFSLAFALVVASAPSVPPGGPAVQERAEALMALAWSKDFPNKWQQVSCTVGKEAPSQWRCVGKVWPIFRLPCERNS